MRLIPFPSFPSTFALMSSFLKSLDFPSFDAAEAERRGRQKRTSSSKGEDSQKRNRSPSVEQPASSTSKRSREEAVDVGATGNIPSMTPDNTIQPAEPEHPATPYVPASVSEASPGESSLGIQISDLESASAEDLAKVSNWHCQQLQQVTSLLSAKVAKEKEAFVELKAAQQEAAHAKEKAAEWEAKYNKVLAERENMREYVNKLALAFDH